METVEMNGLFCRECLSNLICLYSFCCREISVNGTGKFLPELVNFCKTCFWTRSDRILHQYCRYVVNFQQKRMNEKPGVFAAVLFWFSVSSPYTNNHLHFGLLLMYLKRHFENLQKWGNVASVYLLQVTLICSSCLRFWRD